MKVAWLFALVVVPRVAFAEDELPPPQVCDDQLASCKEDCTINYGTTLDTRDKFGRCLTKCRTTHDTCLERFLEVRHNELSAPEPSSTRTSETKSQYPRQAVTPEASPDKTVPLPVDRTATRGEELPPPVDKEPDPYPSGNPAKTPPAKAEATKPPLAQAKATPKPESTPPPAKPKKDLSEWDPGDVK